MVSDLLSDLCADLGLRDADPFLEQGPEDGLVAGWGGQGALVAVVPPQVPGKQSLDVEGWDEHFLVCQ